MFTICALLLPGFLLFHLLGSTFTWSIFWAQPSPGPSSGLNLHLAHLLGSTFTWPIFWAQPSPGPSSGLNLHLVHLLGSTFTWSIRMSCCNDATVRCWLGMTATEGPHCSQCSPPSLDQLGHPQLEGPHCS